MLVLPIKKQWFDMILSGKKKQEYWEIKPYYTKRFQKIVAPYLLDKDGVWDKQWEEECRIMWYMKTPFDVIFRNGYSSDSPSFVARVSISIGEGKKEWGAIPGEEYYVLDIVNHSDINDRA